MLFAACNSRIPALCFLLGIGHASTITTAPRAVATAVATETCEFRTINYITDILPQQCLKSSWSSPGGTSSTKREEAEESSSIGGSTISLETTTTTNAAVNNGARDAAQAGEGTEALAEQVSSQAESTASSTSSPVPEASSVEPEPESDSEELDDSSFLSFEEWRKQTLAKAGQENTNIGGAKPKDRRRDSEGIQNHLDSLGDEGEIALDFDAFKRPEKQDLKHGEASSEGADDKGMAKEKKKDRSGSSDAGKTCKERANYASFDAGATVLKTHKGAKNSKAILIENKDSYMLSECRNKNKFVIIELSEDVWIDTLVLANYEFFSSMIRTFKVSVSERYPVKIDKWIDVGTYQARNSREIQAFLIKNPQIWARYLRVEFLEHYGNEYYCPLSLIRVHGARMYESWKESEANNDDDDEAEAHEEIEAESRFVPDAVADAVQEEEKLQADLKEAQAAIDHLVKEAQEISQGLTEQPVDTKKLGEVNVSLENAMLEQMTTPWVPGFDFGAWMNISQGLDVCLPKESPTQPASSTVGTPSSQPNAGVRSEQTLTSSMSVNVTANETASLTNTPIAPPTISPIVAETRTTQSSTSPQVTTTPSPTSDSSIQPNDSSTILSSAAKLHNITSSIKSKISSTSSAVSATPTQQESFFKAVSRRLQLLEANSTLSLKYIEEQSRTLREAFSRVEKRQLNKTTTFLNTLNSTVLTELKEIRQQYDEIWQSTVISLESQRAESRKEIFAITARLNILADEVVFQKRMSIVQSVLLLLCLGLVIFSRVSSGSPMYLSNRSRYFNNYSVESPIVSPPGSPDYTTQSNGIPVRRNGWANDHARLQSDDSMYSPDDEEVIYEEEEEEEDDILDDQDDQYEDDGNVDVLQSPPTPTSLYSRSSSVSLTSPPRSQASTPVSMKRPSPLSRTSSSSYAQYNERVNGNQNVHPAIPARLSSFKDKKNNDLAVPRSRRRARSDPHYSPPTPVAEPSDEALSSQTPRVSNFENGLPHGLNDAQLNTESTTPYTGPLSTFHLQDTAQMLQSTVEADTNSTPVTASGVRRLSLTNPQRNFSLPTNGQSPAVTNTNVQTTMQYSTALHSPPTTGTGSGANVANGNSPSGRRGRNRHSSNGGSFSIARKPLPALPTDDRDDGDEGGKE